MKPNNVNNSSRTKEKPIMQKFIVETETPKSGQVASSGGVRAKDGSMVSQYKNPKPFVETPPTSNQDTLSLKEELKYQLKNIFLDVAYDLWVDFARPVVSAKLNQLGQQLMANIQQPKPIPIKADTIIDVEDVASEEIEFIPESNNIIQFPNKKAM